MDAKFETGCADLRLKAHKKNPKAAKSFNMLETISECLSNEGGTVQEQDLSRNFNKEANDSDLDQTAKTFWSICTEEEFDLTDDRLTEQTLSMTENMSLASFNKLANVLARNYG